MITTGTRVRCELESRGRIVTIEGRVTKTHGARFADVALGLGGTEITMPVGDLEVLSATVIPFRRREVPALHAGGPTGPAA